ncbi:3746_t:CDS:1, partial [Ambispora gerdemannii]
KTIADDKGATSSQPPSQLSHQNNYHWNSFLPSMDENNDDYESDKLSDNDDTTYQVPVSSIRKRKNQGDQSNTKDDDFDNTSTPNP